MVGFTGILGSMTPVSLSWGGDRLVYIASREDREAIEKVGAVSLKSGKVNVVRPIISKSDYRDFKFLSVAASLGHDDILYPFLQPGTRAWLEFMETRKIVEYRAANGNLNVAVASNIADKLNMPGVPMSRKSKTYKLVQLLTDPEVQLKFGLGGEIMSSLRIMAVSQPDQAALRATEMLRRSRPDLGILVVADGYSVSKKRARDAISTFCGRFAPLSATIDSMVIGDELCLECGDCKIFGPLGEAASLSYVHRAVSVCGPQSVMTALGSEFTLLRVDISHRDNPIGPEVVKHVGTPSDPLLDGSSPLTDSLLSAQAKMWLAGMRASVSEVTLEGVVVASSVRLTAKRSLMNAHVVEVDGCMCDGKPVSAIRSLSSDLWLIESGGSEQPSWAIREPTVGERVFVCYRGPTGDLQYTSPMSLLSVGREGLTMGKLEELRPGMSGGAILAMDDLALVGIYEGVGRQVALGLSFTPDIFSSVHGVSESSGARGREGDSVYRMKDKGLAPYVQRVYESVQPLYSGDVHVGMGFGVSGALVTSCSPEDKPISLGPGQQPLVFSDVGFSLYSASVPGLSTVGLVRSPRYHERVVVVCRDDDGPYYSSESRVVHVGVGSKNFSLEAVDLDEVLPFSGGLVMSLTDAAVVGVYVRRSRNSFLGEVEFCVGFPDRVETGGSTSAASGVIAQVFPTLRPLRWPDGCLEEVITHASVGRYENPARPFNGGMGPLALVGLSYLRLRLAERRRLTGQPVATWDLFADARLSYDVLATLSERLGLSSVVKYGSAVSAEQRVEGSALIVCALAGTVWSNEPSTVVDVFTDSLLALIEEECQKI